MVSKEIMLIKGFVSHVYRPTFLADPMGKFENSKNYMFYFLLTSSVQPVETFFKRRQSVRKYVYRAVQRSVLTFNALYIIFGESLPRLVACLLVHRLLNN